MMAFNPALLALILSCDSPVHVLCRTFGVLDRLSPRRTFRLLVIPVMLLHRAPMFSSSGPRCQRRDPAHTARHGCAQCCRSPR